MKHSLTVKIRNRLRLIYMLTDLFTTGLAIFLFNVYRWHHLDWESSFGFFYSLTPVWGFQIFFPCLMMVVYWLSGYYNNVENRSRAQELLTTCYSAAIGAGLVFFLAVSNDVPHKRSIAIYMMVFIGFLLFSCVYLGRFLITRLEVKRIHRRHKFSNALMIGTDSAALALARKINTLPKGMGIEVTGFVKTANDTNALQPCDNFEIFSIDRLPKLCTCRAITNIILSPRFNSNRKEMIEVLRKIFPLGPAIYVAPDVDMLAYTAHRSFNVVGEPLVCISRANISESSSNIKRLFDLVFSSIALVILLPVFAAIAIAIKLDDGGKVFFTQERVGYRNRPFRIIKFRSMKPGAESEGLPRLASDYDSRVTRVGRFLRKYRLDEIPQFINVLRGEMSIVGPRPERRYFAEQIAARVPFYHIIYQVRPGITSWGMVRYGYASTIDEMVERLRYDLIYLENISIATDFKIMLHTVNTIISGRGK